MSPLPDSTSADFKPLALRPLPIQAQTAMKLKTLLATTAVAATALPLSALAQWAQTAAAIATFLDSLAHAFAHPFTGEPSGRHAGRRRWSALTMPGLRTAWRAPAAFVALLVAGAVAGFAGLSGPGRRSP